MSSANNKLRLCVAVMYWGAAGALACVVVGWLVEGIWRYLSGLIMLCVLAQLWASVKLEKAGKLR